MHVAEYVADMMALEGQLQAVLADHVRDVAAYPGAEAAVPHFQRMVEEHRDALRARLQSLGGTETSRPTRMMALSTGSETTDAKGHPASRVLHAWYSAFNHLALGYAVVHAVAHRFYDSQEEGNTADLAEEHLRRYAGAAQEINQLISDVVVWELGSGGQQCRCDCPSCGLGVCLCAPHGTNTVNQAWRETTPTPKGPGIRVRPPRNGSAAAQAGLGEGDRIVGVDDQQLPTDLDTMTLQKAIGAHQSGQSVRLDVLRAGSERLQVDVTRP